MGQGRREPRAQNGHEHRQHAQPEALVRRLRGPPLGEQQRRQEEQEEREALHERLPAAEQEVADERRGERLGLVQQVKSEGIQVSLT